jgi:hypothetical protein
MWSITAAHMEVFLSKPRTWGKSHGTWNNGITVNESQHGCLGGRDEGGEDTGCKGGTTGAMGM